MGPKIRERSLTTYSTLREYAVLKARVHEVLILGRKRVETEFNRMRYETGLLINEHVRLNQDRTAYGSKVIPDLARDFDLDESELGRYAQFAKAYPIPGHGRKLRFNLAWRQYRKLITVSNDELRWKLTAQAEKNEWDFDQVEAKVRYAIGKDHRKKPDRLPFVCLGPFFTYQVVRSVSIHSKRGELLLDLGFKFRKELRLFKNARFKEGMILTGGQGSFKLTKMQGATDEILYTYKARVEKVIDGDTLKVDFFLGMGDRKGETIRLNHIDCPEITTPEGRAAKRFVQSQLAGCEFITIKSTRTRKEKWGRYLGDVFYQKNDKGPFIYLNQLLLDKGYAVKK